MAHLRLYEKALCWPLLSISALALLAISLPACTAFGTAGSKPGSSSEVPPVMYQFLSHMTKLQPYMVSRKKFRSPENHQQILLNLDELAKLSNKLHQYSRLNKTTFHISAELLEDRLQQAAKSFKEGKTAYAQRMLRESLTGCSSCHIQVVTKSSPSWVFKKEQLSGTDYERAAFLYATRNYDIAAKLYKSFIKKFNPKKDDQFQYEPSLKKVLSYYIRIKRDPNGAMQYFRSIYKKSLPKYVQKRRKSWLKQLREIKKTDKISPTKVSADYLTKFIRTHAGSEFTRDKYDDSKTVKALYLSGLLYEFINSHPQKDITPAILYWLAIFDERLDADYLNDLSELYLRQCIVSFPKNPMAKKCYQQLSDNIEIAFTGSAGVNIPADVQESLDKLKRLIQDKK